MKKENFIIYFLITVFTIIIAFIFNISVWQDDNISISAKYFRTGIIMSIWLVIDVGIYAILKTIDDNK
jgi:hypothetical protein